MERLSGLDASFLYLETPTLHMHVAMTLVFDPSTVPGGLLLREDQGGHRHPHPLRPGVPAPAGRGAVPAGPPGLGGRPRLRHRLPRAAGRAPRAGRAARAGRPGRRHRRPPARPFEAAVGDLDRRGAGATATSASSPRCTTRRWTGCRGPSCSRCSSTSSPIRRRHAGGRTGRAAGGRADPLGAGADDRGRAWPGRMRPLEMTRDIVRTGHRVLNVAPGPAGHAGTGGPVQGRPPPVRPPHLVQHRSDPAPARWPSPPSGSTT